MVKQFQIVFLLFLFIFEKSLTSSDVKIIEEQSSNNDTDTDTEDSDGDDGIQLHVLGKPLKRNQKNSSLYFDKYRYQVAIEEDGDLIYGGSVISSQIVITAAHCFHDRNITDLQVRVGSMIRVTGGQILKIHSYRIHPLFDYSLSEKDIDSPHDIAVVVLQEKMKSSLIRPVLLPNDNTSYQNHELIATGWGAPSIELQPELRYAKIALFPRQRCLEIDAYSEKKLCGKAVHQNEGTCNGDSGGPLVDFNLIPGKPVLVGVISSGIKGCGKAETVAFFMDVFAYKDWILDHIKEIETNLIPALHSNKKNLGINLHTRFHVVILFSLFYTFLYIF